MVEIAQLSDSGQKVFEARYAAKDEQGRVTETFEQAVYRLARTTALAEKAEDRAAWEEKFAASIGGLLFVPSTPIWANIGKTDRPWQPGACFVLSVEDSLESMYQTLRDTAMVFKSGGGVGYNFSAIRPKGAMVRSTKGQASGVVELIRLYDASSGMVMQGGVRRGASMGILNVGHPEIEHFINSKRGGDITHFNLSVGVTGAFMEALERDEDWPLVFNGEVLRTVRAQELWDLITESAHACGDPGIIYLDRLQRDNPVPEREINATNPCVTADTRLATQFGMVPIGELYARGEELRVTVDRRALGQNAKGTEVRPAVPAFMTAREADVYRVVTEDGYEIKATEWHEFYTARGKLPLRDVKPGDSLLVQSGKGQFGTEGSVELGTLLGLITGDGHFTNRGRGQETVVLNFWGVDRVLAPAVAATVNAMIAGQANRPRYYRVSPVAVPERNHVFIRSIILARVLQHYGFTRESKLRVPEVVWRGTEACVKAYLRALFQTDGTVNVSGHKKRSCSARLASSHESLLKDVQMLLANFGVFCRIRKRREASMRRLPDGYGGMREYACRADYELIIDGESRERFMSEIGFLLDYKAERYHEWVRDKALRTTQRFVSRVTGIELVGREPVFDTTQSDRNTVIFNGLVTGQCGEQPLSPGESCLLGSVNFARLLKPGRDGYVVDWELLRDTVRLGIRFLDNLIDVAEYPLEFIAEATRATRKVGLGYTGLHDLLIKAGLPYDSEDGRRFASTVLKAVQDTAHAYSRDLADERGCFPEWERSVFHPREKRRNAACITVAPTGSVTTIAGCEGYGIEPIFAVAYTKDTDVAGSFEIFSPLFLEACERYGVAREVMSEVAKRGGCQGVEGVPAELTGIFKGAQEISPRDHILMQAEVQKYVCNAVSKCLAEGTLVQTNLGVIPVEELGGARGDDVFGPPLPGLRVLDKDGRWQRVTAHYSGGRQETRIVRFNNGLVLEGSVNHRLMTAVGWKKLEDLKTGEYVQCRYTDYGDRPGGLPLPAVEKCRCSNKVQLPKNMDEELALLLGMLVADGSMVESTGYVGLTCADPNVAHVFSDLCFKVFGFRPRVIPDKRRPHVKSIYVTSRRLVRWIEMLIGKGCRHKRVPEAILRGSVGEQRAFMRGATLDGYLKKRGHRTELVVFAGYAKQVAEGILAMLHGMGVAPYRATKRVTATDISYEVVVAAGVVEALELHKRAVNDGHKDTMVPVPTSIADLQRPARHPEYRNLKYLQQMKPAVARASVLKKLDVNYDSEVYYVRVTSVDSGYNRVYDIEVEDTHSYTVSGVVSHNTINLPNSATIHDIETCYRLAYELGLKGITVFRDGCKQGVVTVGRKKREVAPGELARGEIMPRPENAQGVTHRLDSGCGKIYLTVNYHPVTGEILETFITTGSDGGCLIYTEATSRLISLAIRGGIGLEEIIEQLQSTHACPSYQLARGRGRQLSPGKSCASAIAKKLIEIQEELVRRCNGGEAPRKRPADPDADLQPDRCEVCGLRMNRAEGCYVCPHCGFAKC